MRPLRITGRLPKLRRLRQTPSMPAPARMRAKGQAVAQPTDPRRTKLRQPTSQRSMPALDRTPAKAMAAAPPTRKNSSRFKNSGAGILLQLLYFSNFRTIGFDDNAGKSI